jgi:hypothetical protein
MNMKNLINVLLLFLTAFIFSCTKENLVPEEHKAIEISISELRADLQLINKKHQAYANRDVDWAYWIEIGMTDLACAETGAWYGSFLGPNTAVLGGVLFGAAGSYAVSKTPNDGNGGIDLTLLNNITNYDVSSVLENPNSNPYDLTVGRKHNEMLQKLFIKNGYSSNTNSNNVYANIILSNDQVNLMNSLNNEFVMVYDECIGMTECNESIALLHNITNDAVISEILTNYYQGLVSSNFSSLLPLTFDYESYVINHALLTNDQKEILLLGFSVGKYSMTFWYENK